MILTTAAECRRLDLMIADYARVRFTGPGNPMGTQTWQRAGIYATKVPFVPTSPQMNRVFGMEDSTDLEEILEFYGATQQPCWIEVPAFASSSFTSALIQHGFRPEYHTSVLASELPRSVSLARHAMDEITFETIGADAQPSVVASFLDTLNLGFGQSQDTLSRVRRNQSFWPTVSHWRLFLARCNGIPAGGGVLTIQDRYGYLAAASVLPEYRRRGVQQALIELRIRQAEQESCTVVLGQADFASSSQCNMQRRGLNLIYTKAVWSNR